MTGTSLRIDRLRAREHMLATLSHEIRTPLNGVLGMAGLLADTRLDATQTAYLNTLRECGEHLLGLVNDALDYAKLEAGRVELEPIPTKVEALLQGVSELLSPRAHAGGVEIAWATVGAIPTLVCDDGRLRQILFNLAGNAVKLTKSGGVTLTAQADDEGMSAETVRVRFTIADTGPGLAEEEQARIFEEFVQTKSGEAVGGAGLGLAIVRRLADAFGGEVGVVSTPGAGAGFWFEAAFQRAPQMANIRPEPPGLKGALIAVISPSPIVRNAAILQIEASGGRAIGCAAYGEAPLNAQAMLVDVALFGPRARLQPPKSGPAKDIPALILLAPEARRRIAAARAGGFAGYLIKPLRRASVAERLSAVLAERDARSFPAVGPSKTPMVPAPFIPTGFVEDERAAAPALIGARVLLAEDNPVNALLARALLIHVGCVVDRATSGEEAVALALRTPYDLILMDLRMPGVDGLSATRMLREAAMRAPIVAVTANAFDEDRRACLEAGMDDFLTKPLDHRALNAVLARWVQPRGEGAVAAA